MMVRTTHTSYMLFFGYGTIEAIMKGGASIVTLTERVAEKALLVGLTLPGQSTETWQLAFDELQGLVETAGAQVVSTVVQNRTNPDPASYIGSGKASEISSIVKELEVNTVVFDAELTPAQIRNLERLIPCKVLDRTQVILDIFASRARSREGKLQVELAQLMYMLPRLTGRGIEMSRLGGGIGTRGPGETKLEVDRRRIRNRIADLRREIRDVARHRTTQRARRQKMRIPVIALIGYTNAGKSTLLRELVTTFGSGSKDVAVGQNRLFDTLDPTARRITLPNGASVVVMDTVGFIQQLPHTLIDSFRSTLEETLEADLILHVVDASHPQMDVLMKTVYSVLQEIGASKQSVVTVYNKVDLVPPFTVLANDSLTQKTVRISAETGEGVDTLIPYLEEWLRRSSIRARLLVPYNNGHLISMLHEECHVYEEDFRAEGVWFEADVPTELIEAVKPFLIEDTKSTNFNNVLMGEEEKGRTIH